MSRLSNGGHAEGRGIRPAAARSSMPVMMRDSASRVAWATVSAGPPRQLPDTGDTSANTKCSRSSLGRVRSSPDTGRRCGAAHPGRGARFREGRDGMTRGDARRLRRGHRRGHRQHRRRLRVADHLSRPARHRHAARHRRGLQRTRPDPRLHQRGHRLSHQLGGQRRRILKMSVGALLGGLDGRRTLLLALPATWFERIVPVLVGLAIVLGPSPARISRSVRRRRAKRQQLRRTRTAGRCASTSPAETRRASRWRISPPPRESSTLSLMGVCLDETLQRLDAVRNVLVAIVLNTAAARIFISSRGFQPAIGSSNSSAIGSLSGGLVGPDRPPPQPGPVLRVLIAVVGIRRRRPVAAYTCDVVPGTSR